LRERRDNTTKILGHGGSRINIRSSGDEGTFMEVYGKAGGLRENIEGCFEVGDMLRDSPDND
jgi:hypothetical protein